MAGVLEGYGSSRGHPCLIDWCLVVQMVQRSSSYNISASGRLMRPAWKFHAFIMRAAWDLNTRRVIEEARGPPQLNPICNAGRVGLRFQKF
ncbi:hypothetical protein HanRHA438_Chr07g0316901 [Helianthus annuus]|nr:hypothetical protein HanRHA438_Chr07g0316901 [Helianthus annuus]